MSAVVESPAWQSLSSSSQAAFEFAVGCIRGPSTLPFWSESEAESEVSSIAESSAMAPPDEPLPTVTSSTLLVGLLRAHEGRPDPDPVRGLLRSFSLTDLDLERTLREMMPLRHTKFDPSSRTRPRRLTDFPPMTRSVSRALDEAQILARRTRPAGSPLPLSFLFGGVLHVDDCGAYKALSATLDGRADLDLIRDRYDYYLSLGQGASIAGALTTSLPTEAGKEDESRAPVPGETVAGFNADGTVGQDMLDRRQLVGHVARWLTAKNLQTPLAIGLFGEWGSGKSFFMRDLRDHITELSRQSAHAEASGRDTAYWSHVRQVDFNAWLYSDSEIWPSLAAQVFSSVAGGDDGDRGTELDVERLRDYWSRQNPAFQPVIARLRQAQQEEAAARDRLAKLATRKEDVRQKQLALLPKDVRDTVQAAADVRELLPRVGRLGEAWRQRPGRMTAVLVALVVVVASLVIAAVGLWTKILPIAAAAESLLVLVAAGTPFLRYGARYLQAMREASNVDARMRAAETKRLEAERAGQEAKSELDTLARKGVLWSYASGQAAHWSGREKLGVVSEIRRDFDSLSSLIGHSVEARQTAGATDGQLPVDRVVVYIDDLDRCQPELVVRVLEAIKLLMNLSHFVVVVGVDSRWLFRSLEVRFKDVLGGDETGPRRPSDGDWAATPQSYLEKIFQFSLFLPRMNADGYGRLVDSLFPGTEAEAEESPSSAKESVPGSGDNGQRPPEQSSDAMPVEGETPDGQPVAGEPSSSPEPAYDLTARDLTITAPELDLMRRLSPLIDTPRSAKRLTNVYRLLRVIEGDKRLAEAYDVVLPLLAIIVGFPRQSSAFLRAIDTTRATTWHAFVENLAPTRDADSLRLKNGAIGVIPDEEAEAWERISSGLRALEEDHSQSRGMSDFKEWVPIVGNYTFQASRTGWPAAAMPRGGVEPPSTG